MPDSGGLMDPGLVVRAQHGDEVAFALITQAVHGRFKQVAYRILRDRQLAEDAMQQALVAIWRKLPTLRIRSASMAGATASLSTPAIARPATIAAPFPS